MIHTGTSLKYNVIIEAEDFNMRRDPWHILIEDRFHRVIADLDKSDLMRDSVGLYYILLPNVPTGKYKAITTANIPDRDYEPNYMVIIDKQHLVDVGLCDCKPYRPCSCQCETDGMKVTFTRVYTKSIDGADYLVDKFHRFIRTSEGDRIRFINHIENEDEQMADVVLNMTGEEFKQLIEGHEPNGVINTIPEVMNALQGISDQQTVKEEITEDIKSDIEEDQAEHGDIDEIFGDEGKTIADEGDIDEIFNH